MPHLIFLLLGSNLGDRKQYLNTAIDHLQSIVGEIQAKSGIYKTAAWGNTNQPDFYNQALSLATTHAPLEVLHKTQQIEKLMGREKREHWGERIIDIDILLFDDLLINTPTLTVPHPELINRRFALIPLNEIAAEFIHPTCHKTINQLLKVCPDQLLVERVVEEA